MNNSQSTTTLNKSALYRNPKHLKLNSLNEILLAEIIPEDTVKTAKDEGKKKSLNINNEEKEKNYSKQQTLKGKKSIYTNSYNTEFKEKFSLLRELEIESGHRSSLQDSKSSLDRSTILKVYEELAEMKHLYSKQQNEIRSLKDNIIVLKSNISQKMQEINLLNSKHKELADKYYTDSEENKKLKKENFVLKENSTKQQYIFKSTIGILIDLIDDCVFKHFNDTKAVHLNNNVFDNTAEALREYNSAVERSSILKEIKKIMVNNLSYANKALNINMEKELEKVNSFLITQPVNPLNNNSFRFSFFNDDYHSKNSSPRFTHDKIIYDSAYINTFQEHLEDSIKDPLETNVNTNDKDKLEDTYQRKMLDLNDKLTDFNYDILEDSFIIKANDNFSNL